MLQSLSGLFVNLTIIMHSGLLCFHRIHLTCFVNVFCNKQNTFKQSLNVTDFF